DQAVVDRDFVAHVDGVDKLVVVDADGAFLDVDVVTHGDGNLVAGLEVQVAFTHAGADFGTLRVQQDADRKGRMLVELHDVLNDAIGPLVRGVRHVEPDDVHPGFVHGGKHFIGAGGGADGADDLGLAHGRAVLTTTAR